MYIVGGPWKSCLPFAFRVNYGLPEIPLFLLYSPSLYRTRPKIAKSDNWDIVLTKTPGVRTSAGIKILDDGMGNVYLILPAGHFVVLYSYRTDMMMSSL